MTHHDRTHGPPLTPAAKRRISDVSARFVAAWQMFVKERGQRTRPEMLHYFGSVDGDAISAEEFALLYELLKSDYRYRAEIGEQPTASEYKRRFPQFQGVIDRWFSAIDDPPESIGPYRITKLIGSGSYGTVFKARDAELDRDVAVKVQRPERDPQVFLKEAKTIASLDHRHIVPVFTMGHTDDGRVYIVSKYIDGLDLASSMSHQRWSPLESAELVAKLADALAYAHERRVYHRDVKPSNVFIDNSGTPYLGDFGLALSDEDYGRQVSRVGTPCYMSPEQANYESHLVDGRSDVFSLGIVFYQLLTGTLPFKGKGADLVQRIRSLDPAQPRELNEAVPAELQRICLKAISKSRTERYIARDMAADLRHFLSAQDNEGSERDHGEACSVVRPKGLRSFEAEDADFFLQLLPGQRDRDGLPPVVKAWKLLIEEGDPNKAFRVGVIYGPSGCGKSSVIRAGILPVLAPDVITILTDASPTHLETRILSNIEADHRINLRPVSTLPEAMASIRRGEATRPRQKVLVVIDQFEQWLHSNPVLEGSDLLTALRQCEGVRLQCLILVRDDFQTGVNRFMRALEIRLIEGYNFGLIDLFSLTHATRVLAAFGRAYGALPEDPAELTTDQQEFLEAAVVQLAENETVISVRLALFAQMVKLRPWVPATLSEVGGAEGVGEAFLDTMFGAHSSSPEYHLHEDAVRAILGSLLPASGYDIKCQARSHEELFEASSYKSRDSFDQLIGILDGELRLITPVDEPVHLESEKRPQRPGNTRTQGYRLTHDYLVPSIRMWLARRQAESWRGRAKLCLEQRASQWKRAPETRFLPGPLEYVAIQTGVPNRTRTDIERRVMAAASRRFGRIATAILITALILGWSARQFHGSSQADAIVHSIYTAAPSELARLIEKLEPYRSRANHDLAATAGDTESVHRLPAALAIVSVDTRFVPYLAEELLSADVDWFPVIRTRLQPHASEFEESFWSVLQDSAAGPARRFNAGLALASYVPQSNRWSDSSAEFLVDHLLSSSLDDQKQLRTYMQPLSDRLVGPLLKEFHNRSAPIQRQIAAAYALDDFHVHDDVDRLARLLCDSSPEPFMILFDQLAGAIRSDENHSSAQSTLVSVLRQEPDLVMAESDRLELGRRRANAAATLIRMGEFKPALDVFEFTSDPESMTQFVHGHGRRGVSASDLSKCLDVATNSNDDDAVFGLLLALGEHQREELSDTLGRRLSNQVLEQFKNNPDSGVHAASLWLANQWDIATASVKLPHSLDLTETREWWVHRVSPDLAAELESFTLIAFPAGRFLRGSPESEVGRPIQADDERLQQVTLTRRIAVADREVTLGLWRMFEEDLRQRWCPRDPGATSEHPANYCNWYLAVQFCRWLTVEAGMSEGDQCYPDPEELPEDQRELVELLAASGRPVQMSLPKDWPFSPEKGGFRLLTEAEWEYVCRSGTTTPFSFGSDRGLVEKYAWLDSNSYERTRPTAQLRPNRRGLFDIHGNVLEWCHDCYLEELAEVDPVYSVHGGHRVLRGGSMNFSVVTLRSAQRFSDEPSNRRRSAGFRICRTLP